MKKTVLAIALSGLAFCAFAKKVKFAVDMDTITPMVTGIHVAGDFQTLAGYAGGDWMSGTTLMTQEGSTSIYSVVVDIPAFSKYEFKFINGDQWYEAEFVPIESRVGYNFNDNRWLYVDSLANDTTFAGAILFSGNAPKGLTLMRFLVDMTNEWFIDPSGVHVAGSFQGWDPGTVRLYSFGANIYEIIAYDTVTTNEFKYYNGNTLVKTESVPGTCASGNNNRVLSFAKDTVLAAVCFSGCAICIPNGIAQNKGAKTLHLYPNPAREDFELDLGDGEQTICLMDYIGNTLLQVRASGKYKINCSGLPAGIYLVTTTGVGQKTGVAKLIKE